MKKLSPVGVTPHLTVLFILLFAFIASDSFSQNWLWARSATCSDTLGYGEGLNVATDPMGNVYITGNYYQAAITFETTTLPVANPSPISDNIFLSKYDSSGNILWAKGIDGGVNGASSVSIAADANGNVYITGAFASPSITFGSFTLSNPGLFLVKYDANGNVIWAEEASGLSGSSGNSVTIDGIGNVYLTGSSTASFTLGSITLNNSGLFLAKFDANGNVIWAKDANSGSGLANSVAVDRSGNVYVTGAFAFPSITFGSTTLTTVNNEDYFLTKFDINGNPLWARTMGGPVDYSLIVVSGNSVSTDDDGNVFVTGIFQAPIVTLGSITLVNSDPNGNTYDIFVAKYDANGNVIWAKNPTGPFFDESYSISADANGNAYLSGSFSQYTNITFDSYTLNPPAGSTDPMFLIKYDPFGNVLCASVLPSGGDDNNAVSADRFGNAYISGDFVPNTFILGSDTLIRTGAEDIFVAKYRCDNIIYCHNIFIPTAFSPNNDGANDTLFVRSECIKTMHLEIYDRLGEKVFETTDITKGWDGNFRGEKMNNAVFVYFLTGIFNDGTAFSKKGDFSLIR